VAVVKKRLLCVSAVLLAATLFVGCGGPVPVVCPVTPLEPEPFPRDDIGDLPWVAASPQWTNITGHLFYAGVGATSTTMPVGGTGQKVLWHVKDAPPGAELIVNGKNVWGEESFTMTLPPAVSPAGDYPSTITLPVAGCWQLELTGAVAVPTFVTFLAEIP
jgi:hypothetical protein